MDFLKDPKKKKQFCYSYGAFVLNGMLALSIGSLLPFVRDARGLDYAFCGLIVSLHSVGNLISSFAAGTLPVWIGRKKSILMFNFFYAFSYLLLIFGRGRLGLALAFTMTGLARGATSNFCNTVINRLAPGKASIINGLHAMFSIGAFFFPIFLMILTARDAGRWTYACWFLAAMGVVSWLLYFGMPEEESGPGEKKGAGSGFGFFKEPLFLLCTGTLFFYLCAEQGVIGWMITYFKDTGLLNASLSQITASILWVMILAGRLTTAWLSTKVPKGKLLLLMGLGLVFFFFLLISSTDTVWIVAGILGFGYSMAGVYPTTVSFAGAIIEKYAVAWSFMLTMASIGSIVMPSVIGKIAETTGIFAGMSSIMAVLFVDMAFIIGLVAYTKKYPENRPGQGEIYEDRKKSEMDF